MKITHTCPKCKIPIKCIQNEYAIGKYINYVYNCGHMELREKFVEEEVKEVSPEIHVHAKGVWPHAMKLSFDLFHMHLRSIPLDLAPVPVMIDTFPEVYKSLNGRKRAYNYQIDGIRFAENSSVNCLIADEMGLGKTIQAFLTVKKNEKALTPTLFITKGAVQVQAMFEAYEWAAPSVFDVMLIRDRINIIPGFKYYIISMDLIACKGVLELLLKLNLKSVIIDECQYYKNASSNRTISLIKLLQEGNIQHKIALSGTPIKNRVSEYFVILNILAPAHFTSYAWFCRQWCIQDSKGNYSKLNPIMANKFHEVTSRWIIRREQKDVQKDLPELRINYQFCEIEDEGLKKSYNATLNLFDNFLKNEAKISSTQLLGWLAKLRAITGQAKVPNAVAFVREFLENSDEGKITVGIHHHSVRDTLKSVFTEVDKIPVLTLSGEDDAIEKNRIVERFKKPEHRLMIMNMTSGGVGLNLQMCNNFIALERQWNGADEDQFHKRFHRDGQKNIVTGTYFIARGTIDEFFHDMVWTKRNNLASVALGDEVDETQGLGFLREFSEFIVRKKI